MCGNGTRHEALAKNKSDKIFSAAKQRHLKTKSNLSQTWRDAGFQAELTSLVVANVYIGPCTHFLFLLFFFFFCLRPILFPFMWLDDLFIYFFSPFFPLLSSIPHFLIFLVSYFITCLRHCATSRKVAGSIPDGVTGIFHWLLSFRTHYGPGVDTVTNMNEYQGYLLGGGGLKSAGA